MKFVAPLSEPQQITLRCMQDHHPSSRVRKRAHAIILSHLGYTLQEIAFTFDVCRQTVSSWFDDWDKHGIAGLYDNPKSGHPMILNEEDEEYVKKIIEEEPRSTKIVVATLDENRGIKVSLSTIRRTLKRAKQKWKRVRKSTKFKRDEKKFKEAKQKIDTLEQRRIQGEADLFYFDAAGFSLNPAQPYAWQPIGKNIELHATGNHGQRLNVLAFLSKENDITPFCFTGSINSEIVISCLDNFSEKLTKRTFVIMDNAPVHRSKAFIENLPKWHKKGLIPKFLPSYCPELNLIEILWKKIKYEWLPFTSYLNFNRLRKAVENILKEFGSKYVINFSS